ncbi:MAG: thioredoxin family protein [Patescibacteria group bacterium]|nr:thioredoxin family protein [Patescibacteria group bacterium]
MKKNILKNKGFNLNLLILILLFIALFTNIVSNTLIYAKIDNIIDIKIEEKKELERPSNLEIILITDSNCVDCYDLKPIIDGIKSANVNITNEVEFQRDSEQAKELIEKYKIERIPTFIISGELDKDDSLSDIWENLGEIKNNELVFIKTKTPYVSAKTGEIRGKVNLTIISDENCKECFNVSLYENLPKQLGMSVSETKRVEYRSSEGRNLVKKHNIKSVPTIIIKGDLEAYPIQTLEKFGNINENIFVLTEVNPPFISTSTGTMKGNLYLTIVADSSCEKCYDLSVYDNIIKQFGLYVKSNRQINASSYEGKYLVNKYKIEAIPTIIMTGDVSLYNKPNSVWSNIGTTEKDGTYVLREDGIKQLGVYKNLTTNKVVGLEDSVQ